MDTLVGKLISINYLMLHGLLSFCSGLTLYVSGDVVVPRKNTPESLWTKPRRNPLKLITTPPLANVMTYCEGNSRSALYSPLDNFPLAVWLIPQE